MKFLKYYIFTKDIDPFVIKEKLGYNYKVFYKSDKYDDQKCSFNCDRISFMMEANNQKEINEFLSECLNEILKHKNIIDEYRKYVDQLLELTIYVEEKNSIFAAQINKENLSMIA